MRTLFHDRTIEPIPMKSLFLVSVLLFSSTIILGQSVSWLKIGENRMVTTHVMETNNGDFIITGTALSRHSANGDLIWSQEFQGMYANSSEELDDGTLIHIMNYGKVYQSSSDGTALNLLLDLKETNNEEENYYYSLKSLKQNGQLYILGGGKKNDTSGTFFLTIDLTSFVLLESAFYPNFGFKAFTILNDGSRILYEANGKVVKMEESGNILWEVNLGDNVGITKIVANDEYIYIIGGIVRLEDEANGYLVIMDMEGNYILNSEHEGGNNYHFFESITLLPNGDVICGGFDGIKFLSLIGDCSISYISATGSRKWHLQEPIINGLGTAVQGLFLQENNRLVVSGLAGLTDYIGQERSFFLGIEELTSITPLVNSSFRIYPNPTQDYLHFDGLNSINSYQLEIFDAQSKFLKRYNSLMPIYVGDLETGIYFLKLKENGTNRILKWVKG